MQLRGKVALVTGASRGLGRGIALELAAAGATVIVTARTVEPRAEGEGSLRETAARIEASGGLCDPIATDHADDEQIVALMALIDERYGQLDILVNNVYSNPARGRDPGLMRRKCWELPIEVWDTMHRVGLRCHYVACVHAVPLMIRRPGGLIINVTSWGATRDIFTLAYGVVKAGVDRLSQGLGAELREFGLTAVSLCPGLVREQPQPGEAGSELVESPRLTGRAAVAIACDPARQRHSGSTLIVAELAREYGFTDVDGRQPRPLY